MRHGSLGFIHGASTMTIILTRFNKFQVFKFQKSFMNNEHLMSDDDMVQIFRVVKQCQDPFIYIDRHFQ